MSERAVQWLTTVLLAGAAAAIVLFAHESVAAVVAALLVVATLVVVAGRRAPQLAASAESTGEAAADLSQLIAPMAEGVLLIGADQRVIAANEAAAHLVGRSLDSMLGVSLIQSMRDHDLAEVARAARGAPVPVRVSASEHDVVATATPVDAGAVRTLLVIEDVTELEQARRARAELVSNLSHELRTPVAAARALAETLQMGVDDVEQRQHFHDRLAEEIRRLGAMVERLLRLSRLESGGEAFIVQPFDAMAVLAVAAQRLEPLARQRQVRIEVAPLSASAVVPPVQGDRERVLELLTNLLDNALRHSPDGGLVRLAAIADGPDVRFEVADEGPGILLSDRERVFERFYTGDRARAANGGTGLGLSIARHIVLRLGGRIWVADHAPGATLCFTLPVAVGAVAETATEPGAEAPP